MLLLLLLLLFLPYSSSGVNEVSRTPLLSGKDICSLHALAKRIPFPWKLKVPGTFLRVVIAPAPGTVSHAGTLRIL